MCSAKPKMNSPMIMQNQNPEPTNPMSKSARVTARYIETGASRYDGNPLISALPPLYSVSEAAKRLRHHPPYNPSDRNLPPHIRLHLIQTALELFVPLPIHTDLEYRFSSMIRNGYVGRNPLNRQHWSNLDKRVDSLQYSAPTKSSSAAPGFTIIGLSGAGKTTGTDRVLGLYPQVIEHTEYHGERCRMTQIVYLKIACPFDGSVKGLCIHFFEEVDRLLGTNECKRYVGSRSSVDQLLPSMARLASVHNLGALVIDEIQHLSQSKSGGRERMLNFFVDLVNRIQLPVVLIGTYAAAGVLGDEFRQIRRGCGQGDMIWDSMLNDDTWKFFVEKLWHYQYVRHATPLTTELLDTLYDECQGITDFAVKMFMLAQTRAITTGEERITVRCIRSVARDSFRMAQPVLRALRMKDPKALSTMKDVAPVPFSSALEQVVKVAKREPHLDGLGEPSAQHALSIPKKHVTAITKAAEKGLVTTTETAMQASVGPHTALSMGKFIRPATEFFGEVNV
jgi:hypothetical protein